MTLPAAGPEPALPFSQLSAWYTSQKIDLFVNLNGAHRDTMGKQVCNRGDLVALGQGEEPGPRFRGLAGVVQNRFADRGAVAPVTVWAGGAGIPQLGSHELVGRNVVLAQPFVAEKGVGLIANAVALQVGKRSDVDLTVGASIEP